jgi:hypothetical protein
MGTGNGLRASVERFERYGTGRTTGVLRYAQDDSLKTNDGKNKGNDKDRSRSPSGMTTKEATATATAKTKTTARTEADPLRG